MMHQIYNILSLMQGKIGIIPPPHPSKKKKKEKKNQKSVYPSSIITQSLPKNGSSAKTSGSKVCLFPIDNF